MHKAMIDKWQDGDSGTTIDGNGTRRRFRLSNVNSPERSAPGFSMSTARTNKAVGEGDEVYIRVVGKDTYGRDIIEMKKNGKDVNMVIERNNRFFRPSK